MVTVRAFRSDPKIHQTSVRVKTLRQDPVEESERSSAISTLPSDSAPITDPPGTGTSALDLSPSDLGSGSVPSISTEHGHRVVIPRYGLEAEPLIQTHHGVPDVGTEAHPGYDFEESAAEGSADALAAPFPLHGNRELRRVVVDVAVPTILGPKETHPGSADRSTNSFGYETHVTCSGSESGRVVGDLRGVEHGPMEGLTAGRDEQCLVEHVEEERLVVWGGGANRVHDPRRLSTRRPRVGRPAPSAFAIRAPICSAAVGSLLKVGALTIVGTRR
jgi:hypothetical protein